MAITVSDTFTRANTSTGTLGSTETGLVLAWQNPSSWAIISNTAEVNGTTNSPAWVNTGVADAEISMHTLNGNGPGVAFWVEDNTNFWMAWLRSNRYLASTSVTCNSCTDCNCGGCTGTGTFSGGTKNTNTSAQTNTSLSCGSCSVGSCAATRNCTNQGNGSASDSYTSACSGSCVNRTNRTRNCATANTCGTIVNVSSSCVSSCSGSTLERTCGAALCTYTSPVCGTSTCGYNSRGTRTCTVTCSGYVEGTNAAASCSGGGGSSINSLACQNCGYTTNNNYDYEYYLRVDRIVNGSASTIVNQFYADTAGSTEFFAAMKVITSGNTYRVLGYTSTAMTTAVSDTGVLTSAFTDHVTALGHGIVLGGLGSASPGSGTSFDNFSVTYEPLAGDSVGVMIG